MTQTRVTKDAFRSCARNISMRHFLLLAVGNHVVPAQQLAASASIHVDEDLSRDLRRQAENFVYTAARAYKEGMKRFGKAMGKRHQLHVPETTGVRAGPDCSPVHRSGISRLFERNSYIVVGAPYRKAERYRSQWVVAATASNIV